MKSVGIGVHQGRTANIIYGLPLIARLNNMRSKRKYMGPISYSLALAIVALLLIILIVPQRAAALPPLGLTLVDPSAAASEFPRPQLEIIDGTGYVSGPSGVWPIDSLGRQPFIPVFHPTLGIPQRVTRVVDGPGGILYVGANFGTSTRLGDSTGAALYHFADPEGPIITWPRYSDVRGISTNLRILGNSYCCTDVEHPNLNAAQFFLDGSASALPVPPGSDFAYVGDVSRLGFGLGDAGVLGDSVVLWPPNGGYVIVEDGAGSRTVRDRSDGTGENVGAVGFYNVYYGSRPPVSVLDQNGIFTNPYAVIVSQGDFVVVDAESEHPHMAFYGYFPVQSPATPTARGRLPIFSRSLAPSVYIPSTT